jgi:hypothetical protein
MELIAKLYFYLKPNSICKDIVEYSGVAEGAERRKNDASRNKE